MMRVLIVGLCAMLLSASAAPAQTTQEALTPGQTQGVVDGLIGYVQKLYVFPEKRAQIVGAIRADAANGRYASAGARELAERLTATLQAASNDKHLTVTFDPPQSKALAMPGEPQDNGYFDAEGRKWNQGYVRQEILPGNIRYVRIKNFFWTDTVTAGVIDTAAQFLSGGSAVVIDLRGNGGGHAAAVQRMISYLMPEKSVELMTFFDGQTGKSEVTKSSAKLPSPRIVGRPVYVLIDRGSVSAAEEFAYHIQQFKLGTLVGETTAGAANNNVLLPLPDGFVASVSYGRPIHPVSKANWEGVGVSADKPAPGPAALDIALIEALSGLVQSADRQIKADAEWELPAVRARLSPPRVAPDDLKRLAGKYGDRTVLWADGQLTVQRTGGPRLGLVQLGPDLFGVAGVDNVRFRFNRQSGGEMSLEATFKDGRKQAAARERASE